MEINDAPDGGGRRRQEEREMPESFRALPSAISNEEEEGDVCRICRNSGDRDNPLHYPCACSGSIKYVHQDCLLQWLNHSNARQCEVCKHSFSFSPVYAENAPTRLPFREFLVGIAMKTCRSLHFFLRLAFVISVWFLIIPFTTFWIWRLTFVRSFVEAQKLFLSRLSPILLLTDCLHGLLLSAGIVFIFLGATSLRDYFRHLRELRGQDAEREDDGIDRQHGGRAGRRLPGQGNRANIGGGNGDAGQGIVGAGQLIRRNAENVAARLEIQAARLEAHVEQIFDGVDDADGAEDVPFDELVGMQGPVFHLVENAITVLASNAIFLGVVIFLPFTLGRIVLFILSRLVVTSPSTILTAGISPLDSALALANMTVQNTLNSVANLSTETRTDFVFSQAGEALAEHLIPNVTHSDAASNILTNESPVDLLTVAGVAALQLSDMATLAVGYMVIFGLVFCYFGLIALIRYNRGEPLAEGRIYGVASIAEAIPSLARQFLSGVNYFMTMVKVAFLLVIELGVFPLLCGWWLDVCTISMLGTTIAQRVAFFWSSPLTSSLLHWLVGIVYMLQISIFVSLLRGVLRPGVLYFLRDPADPNYNPFRDLIDDPIHKHARRVLLSVVVYGSLIVMLVFLPVKVAMYFAPSIFPLDISVSDPFTEIPADMLLFQICIPFAIEHFRPRATIKKILFHWFTVVGWALGLTDFLLPNPEDNNGQGTEIAEHGRQERLHDIHRGVAQELNQNRLALPAVGNDNRIVRENSASSVQGAEEFEGDNSAESEEYMFVLRIVLLLFWAWLTLLSFNSALVVVPVSLGRALFASIPRFPITHGIKCNDLYAFNIGCYIIWAVVAGIGYAVDYLKSHNLKYLVNQVLMWSMIVVKSFILLSLWIFVIPVLIGLLFELLVIVPLRVPINESPVFLLYQDWALGLIFLKIWTRLVMLGQMAPLTDDSWRIKFDQVRADGFSRLRGLWVLQEIVAPILTKLLTALCVPYVFARGLFPLFGYSLIINSAVYRFAWLGCLTLGLLWYCIKRFHQWFMNLHNAIRDDRYLIGRRLHNYGEDISVQSKSKDNAEVEGMVPDSTDRASDFSSDSEENSFSSDLVGDNSRLVNGSSSIGTSSSQGEVRGSLRHRQPRSELSGNGIYVAGEI